MLGTDQSIPMSCEENVKVQRIKVLRPSLKPLCPRLQKSTSLSFKLPSCFSFKTKGESSQSFGIVSLTKLGGARPPALVLGKTTSNKESDKDYANQAVILTSSELLTPAPRLLKPVNLQFEPSSGGNSPKGPLIHRSDPTYITKGSMEENVKASPISTNSFRAMRQIKTIDLNSKTALGLSVGDNSAQNNRERSLTPGSQEDQRTSSGILAVSPNNLKKGSTLTGKIQSQSTMGAAREGIDTSNNLTGGALKSGGRLGHRPSASVGVRGSREVANVGLSGTNNELPAALSDKEKSKSDEQRERDVSPPVPELLVRPSWQSNRAQVSSSPPSQRGKGTEVGGEQLAVGMIGKSYNAQENITEQDHDSSDSLNEDIRGVDPDEAFSLDLVSARRMKITDGQENQSEGEKESDLEIRTSRIKMNMHKGSLNFCSPNEFEQVFGNIPSAIDHRSRKDSVAEPIPRKNSEKPATSTNYTSMRHSTGMTSKLSSYRQGQLSKFSPMFGAANGDTGENKQTDELGAATEQKLSVNYSQIIKINKKLKQEPVIVGADGIPTHGHRRGGSFNVPNRILNFQSHPYQM